MSKLNGNLMDSESIELLSTAKIFSVIDFLQADVEKILLFSKLTAEKVLQLKSSMAEQYCSAVCAVNNFMLNSCDLFISTHIKGIDQLLCGGLSRGCILELCGPSGCGKTQICHSIAVNCAVDSKLVVFIDTKQDFNASRCNMLLPPGLNDKNMDIVLEQIIVYHSRNIYELVTILEKINLFFKSNIRQEKIIIIDSITVPYLPFVGVSAGRGFSILNYIASLLKQLGTEFNAVIILINLGVTYNESEEQQINKAADKEHIYSQEVKPLMGKYWQHIPNTRIIITRDPVENSKRKLVVHKSDYLAINRTEVISMSEIGIS